MKEHRKISYKIMTNYFKIKDLFKVRPKLNSQLEMFPILSFPDLFYKPFADSKIVRLRPLEDGCTLNLPVLS